MATQMVARTSELGMLETTTEMAMRVSSFTILH